MRGFALLLVRELRRRLPVHLVSIGLGLAAIAAPWLGGSTSGARGAEIRGAVAVVVALLWSLVIALVEGFSCLAGDLREGRLAFDFRLPLASTAIWASRLLAGIASVAAAAGIVQLSAVTVGADLDWAWQALLEIPRYALGLELHSPVLFAVLLLLVILFSLDLVGLALASRKPWVGLDFVAVVSFKSLALLAILPLWRATAENASGLGFVSAIAASLIALLLATWSQVSRGRTERDRAHRAFSLTFAPIAILLLVPLFLWSHWFLSPSVPDLDEPRTETLPLSESLVWLSGPARSRGEVEHQFLVEPATGRSLRLGSQHQGLSNAPAKISLDGTTIAWTVIERIGTRTWSSKLRVASTSGLFSGSRPSGVSWDGIPWAWALSFDGSRVASVWPSPDGSSWPRVQMEDLDSGRVLRQISLRDCQESGPLLFLDESRLIYGCGTSWEFAKTPSAPILSIDLESREVAATEFMARSLRPVDLVFARALDRWFEPPGSRPIANEIRRGWIHRKGLEAIPVPPPGDPDGLSRVDSSRFLSDGRLAVAWQVGAERMLAVYDAAGALDSARTMQADELDLLAELRGKLLVLTLRYEGSRIPTPALYRVPLDGGSPEEIERGTYPIRPESSSTPTTLFFRKGAERRWLDLSTGELRPLFAAF